MQFARILDQHHAIGGFCDFGEQGIGERGLAGGGAAGDQDVAPLGNGDAQHRGLVSGHDAGGDVILQRENGDGGFADGKGGGCDHGRQQALEAFTRFREFGGDTWSAGVDLGADMVGDEADNAFAIGGGHLLAGVFQPAGQPVDPQPTVRVEHHFYDGWVFEEDGDCRAERGAQHARAA